MGALHAGHLSLVRASKTECDFTVVTIFVNPSQFGPNEDLDAYPRTLEADLDALVQYGVELVFAPAAEEVYRADHCTWIEVGSVAEPLEGQCRPDHFRGVATIVLKLLNMVGADTAYFGQKDYQQAAVIRRMVEDLDVPIELRVCPTVREPDGLAMSSRNAYLTPDQRADAPLIYRGLEAARRAFEAGERQTAVLIQQVRESVARSPRLEIEYIEARSMEMLDPLDEVVAGDTLLAVAARLGNTRLIDNIRI